MRTDSFVRTRLARGTALGLGSLALAFGVLGISDAKASNFQIGEVEFNTQVTISAGFGVRTEKRDNRLICAQNYSGPGIPSATCNGDDGNLNFDRGDLIYAPVRAQGEIEASWENFTVYARGQAFYDAVYDRGDFSEQGGIYGYRDLSGKQTDDARHTASHEYELMDLWVRGRFDIGDNQLIVKLGQQSISWGEALFSPLSLVQINALDQAKLRQPGAELRDAVRAMPAALVTFEVGGGLSVEGFYQFEFRPSRSDPAGSFFSTTDVGGRGGTGFGGSQDYDVNLPNAGGISTPMADTYEASHDGDNWGVSARYFSPALNNTEFGLYFANITPRSPVPTFLIADDANFISAAELPTAAPALVGRAMQNFMAQNPGATPAQQAAALAQFSSPAGLVSLATAANAANSRLQLSNPGDLQMLGGSFNTSIDALGISLAGEFVWMHDLPILIDSETYATAFVCGLIPVPGAPCGAFGRANQLSSFMNWTSARPGTEVKGYFLEDAYTFQLRGVKQFGSSDLPSALIGASSSSFVAEFGGIYVNLPSSEVLAAEAPGNDAAGNGSNTDPINSKYEPATKLSLGVTAVASASYLDVFSSVNLTPSIRYSTGLYGNSPVTGGFVENASALSFQIDADYLLQWKASIGYTTYFGAGRQNLLLDRDFLSATLTYSF